MNGPASTLIRATNLEDLELDAPALELALRKLWLEAAQAADGPPVARVRVLNLIIYTEDEASAELADKVMSLLPERHPCRGIVVRVLPHASQPLRAALSARCLINPDGARKVCSEQITVTAGADTRALLVDALTPLLVADLPVVLWWTGRPRPADPVFRHFVRGRVDRVLVDSALFRDPAAGLLALSRWNDGGRQQAPGQGSHGRTVLADITWERLRPWRQLLAQTVDAPEARARLTAVERVTIAYSGHGAPPGEALLVAGWLMASFRWQPEDSPAAGEVTFRQTVGARFRPRGLRPDGRQAPGDEESGGRPVTVRFLSGGPGENGAALHAVTLHSADGASFSVRLGNQPGLGICAMEGIGAAPIERTVPFVHRDAARLAVAAIGRSGPDPVYDAALAAAAEIAALGATA